MATPETPETAALQAGADVELSSTDPAGGPALSEEDITLTTDDDAQRDDLPVKPANS